MSSQRTALFTAETEERARGVLASILKGSQRLWLMVVELRNRDALLPLLSLEDWQLQDLGVARDDVVRALRQPLSVPAARELERMRGIRSRG
jgi:uncharacterized protein YjiS (DUF1127 family)